VSCVGPHRRWDEGVVFGGGDVHPWGDGAGNMRIALFGVVVGDGSGGEAYTAAIWRCAMLDHFQHGCRRGVVTPEEAGEEGTVLKCLVASLLEVLPRLLPSQRARELHAESGWFAGGDHLLNDVGPVRRAA
jgi:hypothetical protein